MLVLVTELRSPTGPVRLTDALALRSGADLTDDVPGGRGGEESWRVVAPVMSAWSKDLVPLLEYPAGSQGPDAAAGSPP